MTLLSRTLKTLSPFFGGMGHTKEFRDFRDTISQWQQFQEKSHCSHIFNQNIGKKIFLTFAF